MEQFVASSGNTIAYDVAGEGPPVLACHGIGGGAYFFRGFASRLASRHRVVAVDYPGTGRSLAVPDRMSLERWVVDLGELVASTIQQPVALVGHSLGTILALKAWEAWPQWIDRLVFVGGLPEPRQAARERLGARAEVLRDATTLAGWGPQVSPGNFAPAAFARIPEVVGLFERAFEMQPVTSYVRSIEILLAASATAVVPTVTVPVLSISGDADTYAPPDVVDAFLRQLPTPPTRVVLPDVGHLPFFEQPEAFAEIVGAFLDG